MLIHLWYSKVGKYDREYKYIIYRESLLNDIPRKEFECLLLTKPLVYESIKNKCKRYPYPRPSQRLSDTHFCTLLMKHSEIECKHEENKYIKPYPEPDIDFHEKNNKNKNK